jgi:hypothetical protein
MKNKWVLTLGVLLVCGLAFIGCDNGTTSGDPKSLTIENISSADLGGTDGAWIGLFADLPQGNNNPQFTAVGYGQISGNSVSVTLTVPNNNTYVSSNPWTGNGDYYVYIAPVVNNQIQGNDALIFANGGSTPAKAAFNAALTTLDFGDFEEVSNL